MIDYSSRLTTPTGTRASAATGRCYGNCHDVTSFLSSTHFVHDAGQYVVGDDLAHARMSTVDNDYATASPTYYSDVAGSSRFIDDYELAADAEVCWLLRHVVAETPLTPEIEPTLSGLQINSNRAPRMACLAPGLDSLPHDRAKILAARLPRRTVCHRLTTRRPCLNFEKMQV